MILGCNVFNLNLKISNGPLSILLLASTSILCHKLLFSLHMMNFLLDLTTFIRFYNKMFGCSLQVYHPIVAAIEIYPIMVDKCESRGGGVVKVLGKKERGR